MMDLVEASLVAPLVVVVAIDCAARPGVVGVSGGRAVGEFSHLARPLAGRLARVESESECESEEETFVG